MKTLLVSIPIAVLLISGCAQNTKVPDSVSTARYGIDEALSSVRSTQQKAALQAASISRMVSDSKTKKAVSDLQTTISDLGFRLEDATGKIAWYSHEFDLVTRDRNTWKARALTESAARVQAEKERDALIWIFSVACGMVALSSFRSALQVIQMPWRLLALAGVFVAGFSIGFVAGRYILRFLSLFTPHLPF